jgi:hypothetical protein
MTLCWVANRPSSSTFTTTASPTGTTAPESMDVGTTRLPTKPMAYKNVPKNTK